jgi:hypothetical protein
LISRFGDNLLEPLSRDELSPSESDKITAAFPNASEYADIISIAIQMVHIKDNRSLNALEAVITLVLQKILKLTTGQQEKACPWSAYLLQYVLFTVTESLSQTYSNGINESIKKGVSDFFAPDDLFSIGNAVLYNMIDFKVYLKIQGDDDQMQTYFNFF